MSGPRAPAQAAATPNLLPRVHVSEKTEVVHQPSAKALGKRKMPYDDFGNAIITSCIPQVKILPPLPTVTAAPLLDGCTDDLFCNDLFGDELSVPESRIDLDNELFGNENAAQFNGKEWELADKCLFHLSESVV